MIVRWSRKTGLMSCVTAFMILQPNLCLLCGSEVTSEQVWSRHQERPRRDDGSRQASLLDTFEKTQSTGLKVAHTILHRVTDETCAQYCIDVSCLVWSYSVAKQQCRVACSDCPVDTVVHSSWDTYETDLTQVTEALFRFDRFGFDNSRTTVPQDQIQQLEDPYATEHVLKPDSTEASSEPPPQSTTTTRATTTIAVATTRATTTIAAAITRATASVISRVTSRPPLLGSELFPKDCGFRPVFGLSDNARRLTLDSESVRVIGGSPAAFGTYPWQAEIRASDDKGTYHHSCGGVVVSSQFVLTAAHCHIRHERKYEVRLAEHDLREHNDFERTYPVRRIFIHNLYNYDHRKGHSNDIALIQLKFRLGEQPRVPFSYYLQPACLPSTAISAQPVDASQRYVFVGQECQVSGWGLTGPDQPLHYSSVSPVLLGAVVNILDPALCQRAYKNRFNSSVMICAGLEEGGVDSCQGDSGGPLSCRDQSGQWFVAGIVSFGLECGKKGFPGVYTRVSAYTVWIQRTAWFLTQSD